MYRLSLNLLGEKYESEGGTMLEALMKLPRPMKIMGKGILKVEMNDQEKEILYMPARLKQLFQTSRSAQAILAKQLEFGFIKTL